MAIVLATAVLAGTAQTLAFVAQQHRLLDRQMVAQREAANIMEELAALPWSKLSEESLKPLELSDECRHLLHEPKLRIGVVESQEVAKRIRVEIDWSTTSGQRVAPVWLMTWRYPTEGKQ